MEITFKLRSRFILFVEEMWARHHRFPTEKQIADRLEINVQTVYDLLGNEDVQKSLASRGISLPDEAYLTGTQLAAVKLFLDVNDTRPDRVKFKDLGVTMAQWNGWMQGAIFRDFVTTRAEDLFTNETTVMANRAVARGVAQGSQRYVKMFFDIQRWKAEVGGSMRDPQAFLRQVIEVIQVRVQDPETLSALAEDFDRILNGKAPIVQGAIERGDDGGDTETGS